LKCLQHEVKPGQRDNGTFEKFLHLDQGSVRRYLAKSRQEALKFPLKIYIRKEVRSGFEKSHWPKRSTHDPTWMIHTSMDRDET
jgi:hypothetical protein